MQTTWDLSKIYNPAATDKDFEKELQEYEKLVMEFVNKWNPKLSKGYRDDYLKDAKVLKIALDEYEELEQDWKGLSKVSYYYHLATSIDQLNTKLKAKENKVHDVTIRMANEVQFFGLRIAKIPQSTQKKFLKDKNLAQYHHWLDSAFKEAKYLLSEPEEKIMTLKGKVAYSNWTRLVSEQISKAEREVLDEDGNLATKSFSDIMGLIDNKDKKIRDRAAEALNGIFESVVDIAEAELNSIIENKKIDDSLRKMSRPDESRLVGDDIEPEVVDALRDVVTANNDIAKEFYKLKAKLLGQEKLAYHERNVPVGDIDKKYTFEESVVIIKKVFKDLNPEFEKLVNEFLKGRVDVYPKKGKDNGAFCSFAFKKSQPYIMLNHTNRLNDVLTFAHELGHGIHCEYFSKKQNALNYGASMATAEVASTFMEDFVLQELAKEADDKLRFAINMMKLNDDVSTIIRQIACYNLEMELHTEFKKVGYLSKEVIGQIFLKHMKDYMGDYVEQNTGSENWWVYWSHLRYFFYVYSYASGLLISKSLQNSVKKDPKFINNVVKFFEAGESKSPRDIFLDLGIDIAQKEFWQKGMQEVRSLLEETKELAIKLKLV